MDAATMVYGVMGHPVGHSRSPVMLNAAFQAAGLNACYLAFDVTTPEKVPDAMRTLGICGMSVTIPHKVAIMDVLDGVDPMALAIGAVNTITRKADGRLVGSNTDCAGAIAALESAGPVAGKKVAILGAGGAARAVAFGVQNAGGIPVIVNRTIAKGEALANALGSAFVPLAGFTGDGTDILVNTTSVGMAPDTDASPVPKTCLSSHMTVMDIIYTPRTTRLLSDAAALGCKVVDGLEMFIRQGALQFENWTKKSAPIDVMREAACKTL